MEIVPQLIANSIIAGALYALVALGFNLIYGTVKFFDLGYGAMTAVGGYALYFFFRQLEWGLGVSLAVSIVFSGVLGVALYRFVYAPLKRRGGSHMVMLVASLGVFTTIQALIALIFSSQFKVLAPVTTAPTTVSVFGGVLTYIQLIILLCVSGITAGLVLVLRKTAFGKSVRAIGDDEEVAKIVGIDTRRVITRVFFIGSAIAGIAGILAGFNTGLQPTMGLPLFLKGVIAAIIGGVGNVYGGIVGAFLLGFVENFGVLHIAVQWKDAIAFALLIVFLIIRPQGICKK